MKEHKDSIRLQLGALFDEQQTEKLSRTAFVERAIEYLEDIWVHPEAVHCPLCGRGKVG